MALPAMSVMASKALAQNFNMSVILLPFGQRRSPCPSNLHALRQLPHPSRMPGTSRAGESDRWLITVTIDGARRHRQQAAGIFQSLAGIDFHRALTILAADLGAPRGRQASVVIC